VRVQDFSGRYRTGKRNTRVDGSRGGLVLPVGFDSWRGRRKEYKFRILSRTEEGRLPEKAQVVQNLRHPIRPTDICRVLAGRSSARH
jgi:hypothetical protein